MGSATIADAQQRLRCGKPNGQEQYQMWRSSLATAVADPEFVERNAGELAGLLTEAVRVYVDYKPLRLLLVTARAAARHSDTFVKALAAAVVKQAGAAGGPSRHEAFGLLLLARVALERLGGMGPGAKKAVAKLVEVQAGLAEGLMALGGRLVPWKRLGRHLAAEAAQQPGAAAEMLELCKAPAPPPPAAPPSSPHYLALALLQAPSPQGTAADSRSATRSVLLAAFCDKVINGRERLPPPAAACYTPLAASLTQHDFTDKVLPAVTRALRRTPEVALSALTALLAAAPQLDASSSAGELVGILLQQMRSKESIRPAALACLRALASRCNDVSGRGEALLPLRRLLDGSAEGRIKVAAERQVLASALAALAEGGGAGPECAVQAADTLTFVLQAWKEEANDDARAALLSALGAWSGRLQPLGPHSACAAALAAGLAGGVREAKEVQRRMALRAAAQVVAGNEQLAPLLAPLSDPCAKVLQEALVKPGLRLEGLLALLLLLHLAAVGDEAAEGVLGGKTGSAALGPSSPLLNCQAAARLPSPADACLMVDVCCLLLRRHASILAAEEGSQPHCCRLLLALTVHWSAEVRRHAHTALASLSPQLLLPLALALLHVLENGSAMGVAALAVPPDAIGEDAVVSAGTLATRWSLALTRLLPGPREEVEGEELAMLLLASHHPALTAHLPPGRVAHTWRVIRRQLTGLDAQLPAIAGAVTRSLAGPQGLAAASGPQSSLAVAGRQALGSALALQPATLFPSLLAVLEDLLDRSAHDGLSEVELDVWATPGGLLASEKVPEGVYVPAVVEARGGKKKARGRFASGSRAFADDDGDDDDYTPAPLPLPPRRPPPNTAASNGSSAGAGRGQGGGGGRKDASARQAEWRAGQLASEAQVRAQVEAVRLRLALGLATLTTLATCCPAFILTQLEGLKQLALPLLSSPLVGSEAFTAVRSLSSCLPPPLGTRALALAAAMRLVMLAQQGARGVAATDVPRAAQVEEVVHVLREASGSGRRLLAPATYAFVFPILKAVLSSPVHTPLHDDALGVLAMHCVEGEVVPRADTLGLLFQTLAVVPAYRDRIHALLRQVMAGCTQPRDISAAIQGLVAALPAVRAAALQALTAVPALAAGRLPDDQGDRDELLVVLHMACFDVQEDNARAAGALWAHLGEAVPPSYVVPLVRLATQGPRDIQLAAAAALSAAAQSVPGSVAEALEAVIHAYEVGNQAVRVGVARALKGLARELGDQEVTRALDFLIRNGLADAADKVREDMVAAGQAVVDAHGAAHAPRMLPLFESFLDKPALGSAEEEQRYDLVREGVVVFLGTLARHLPPADPKRTSIVETLVAVLSTPSEAVQRAVSACLPPLMAPLAVDKEYMDGLVARLLNTLTKGKTYGERRGAAFGLSGLVKGLGIMSMKNCGIMDALKAAVEDKKDGCAREGAVLAFECLSEKLGKLFEPYIIYILPLLLSCFGDPLPYVRTATEDAARMIMGQLTASGVKLVLPALLKGLEDKMWRTKQGSVQLLGAMAYCAPKQLGSCLPTIVPRLSEVLNDPHPKVQTAANEALGEIGSVIRNPEVSSLVPSLLSAIADPNSATRAALDTLLETVFVNTIDAASLALIMPVIHRGLRDRAGDTKKRAARIAGNMASLVNDPKDMVPYLPLLMPELQKALRDPLPEVRAMSARAMGSLMQGMGSEQFSDLVPWLMSCLRAEGPSVERSGAAQGLAEVLAVLGTNHLEVLLPDILDGCITRDSAATREGHIVLLQYLPLTLEAVFATYLQRVLPVILDGLSDENEGVREAALAAGRIFVDHYATSALGLLLPVLVEGMFADNWRIRQASVKLLGKLLFKVAGTTGNVVVDGGSDDEGAAEEGYNQRIIEALGMDRRNTVLARLYVCRSDIQYPVRNESLHVWKSVVSNTPKTLGQVLPTLMAEMIESLAHDSEDRRMMAGRCLGELVRKMGERVLARMIPILRDGIRSDAVSTRQGVCMGLKETLENMTRQQLTEYMADMLPTVQTALCDADPTVREAAGAAFSIMFKGGAGGAADSVVPTMLEGLAQPAKFEESLQGLRVILSVKPAVLNYVLPKLMKQPLQLHNLHALGELASVAGPSLANHIKAAVPPLLTLANKGKGEREEAAAQAVAALAVAVQEDGLQLLVTEMRKGLEEGPKRRAAADLVACYAKQSQLDAELVLGFVPQLLDALISLFADDDGEVVSAAWRGVEALTPLIPKDQAPDFVRCVNDAVATAKETERRKRTGRPLLLAGLCLPKALAPLLPIYLAGVLQGGSAEVREGAAEGLGELVVCASEDALRPHVVQITGPLIRIIGDRFPSSVKSAILGTLGGLIAKAGTGLKPFVPQLQTTFLKCLADPADAVRQRAARNLGELVRLSPRADQLAGELATSARSAEPEVRDAYLLALRGLLLSSGERLSPAVMETLGQQLRDMARLAVDNDEFRYSLASCLGAHTRHASMDQVRSTLSWGPLAPPAAAAAQSASDKQLHACVLATVAPHCGGRLAAEPALTAAVMDAVTRYARDPDPALRVSAGRAASRMAVAVPSLLTPACQVLGALLGPDQSTEVARQALLSVRRLAQGLPEPEELVPFFPTLIPPMCALAANTSGPVKVTCELSLQKVLQLEAGLDVAQRYLATGPGTTVRTTLTDAFLRRAAKLSGDDELFSNEEY